MRQWTREDFVTITKLRKQGLAWAIIAERLGVTTNNLEVNWWRFKNGLKKFASERWAAEREAFVARFMNGETVTDIARSRGISRACVSNRLNRAGLDAEARHEIREGRWA